MFVSPFGLRFACVAGLVVGCTGGPRDPTWNEGAGQGPPDSGPGFTSSSDADVDGGADGHAAAVDAGMDGPREDAARPPIQVDMAQITALNGGSALAHPVVVTVTWSTDPNAAQYEAFGDAIGGSAYWHTLNGEYGVGAAVSGASNHVRIASAPPSTLSDTDLDTLVATNAGNAGSGWPAPTPQTIYAVYVPGDTSVTYSGTDWCQSGGGGWHDGTTAADGTVVDVAVMVYCPALDDALSVMATATHELNEAATDPPYAGYDADHLSWGFLNHLQPEVGDACEFAADAVFNTSEPSFAYEVQRQWSNESARAGHDPCVPVPTTPYFNAMLWPSEEQAITVDLTSLTSADGVPIALDGLPSGPVQTKGFKATLQEPSTFHFTYYNDAPTGPWTIAAHVDPELPFVDANGNAIPNGAATVGIDKTSGNYGDVATVTVTPSSFNAYGVVFVYLTSTLGPASYVQPLLVGK